MRARLGVRMAILLVSLFALSASRAAVVGAPKSPFRVGEKVECDWGGQLVEAEVLEITRLGWLKLRLNSNGMEMTPVMPPERVRKITGKASASNEEESEPTPNAAHMRTWTDRTGKHKTRAEFVSIEDGQIRLRKSDGTIVAMPLDKLSPFDQHFAMSLARHPLGPSSMSGLTKSEPAAPAVETAKADWSQVRLITANQSAKATITPDAAEDEPSAPTCAIALGPRPAMAKEQAFFEHAAHLLIDRKRHRILVVHANLSPRGGGVRLECCDLETSRPLGCLAIPTATSPVDLDPTGSQIVGVVNHPRRGFEGMGRVEVWRLGRDKSTLVSAWDSRESDDKMQIGSGQAVFVSPERVLTVNTWRGTIVLWDVRSCQAIYSLPGASGCLPALSPNRKQLAVMTAVGVCVFDPNTGETLARLPAATAESGTTLGFRRDGRALAALSSERLRVWDLQRGEMTHEIWFPRSMGNDSVDWVDDGHVLAGKSFLIDLERRIVLWQYQLPSFGFSRPVALLNGTMAYALTEQAGFQRQAGLFFTPLPHPEARQTAASLSAEQLLVIKPGVQVSLDVGKASTNPAEVQQVADSLTAKLKANGMAVVASGAPLVLEASVQAGKTDTVTYESLMPQRISVDRPERLFEPAKRETQTVSLTEKVSQLVLRENGKVIWQRLSTSGNYAPAVVFMKDGESLNAKVAEKQPSPLQFLLHATLPPYLARHDERLVYGTSMLTPHGPAAVPSAK